VYFKYTQQYSVLLKVYTFEDICNIWFIFSM